jgi:hypothetical protein
MTTINSYTATRFKLNGFPCAKVYQLKPGTDKKSVTLININDTSDVLFRNKNIDKIAINGFTYPNLDSFSDALENLLYCNGQTCVEPSSSGSGVGGVGISFLG